MARRPVRASRCPPGLHAIGAFVLEVGHVRERVRQPIAGEIRLQWWQDVVDGSRSSEAAAHPVAAALLDTMARADLSQAVIADMIDAYRIALYDEPPADMAALERRLIALRGTPIRLAAQVLGVTGEAIEAATADAGVALGIMDLVTALPRPAGRVTPCCCRATYFRGTAPPRAKSLQAASRRASNALSPTSGPWHGPA